MSSIWGNAIKVSIFGESHGSGIGVVLDGLPPGLKLGLEQNKHGNEAQGSRKKSLYNAQKRGGFSRNSEWLF